MENITDKNFWGKAWADTGIRFTKPSIDPVLIRYLPLEKDFDFIELGCTPGNNMLYFNKTFLYNVSGLDYAGIEITDSFLKSCDIHYELIDMDMFELKSSKQYDVVFSTGVVEHFDPVDNVFDVHKNLCRKGGYVVVSLPNMRYFNKLIVKMIRPELIKIHNLKIMSPKQLKNQFDDSYDIVYCNYHKTTLLNLDSNYDFLEGRKTIKLIHSFLSKIMCFLRIDNIPNRFLSPNIVIIAKKK